MIIFYVNIILLTSCCLSGGTAKFELVRFFREGDCIFETIRVNIFLNMNILLQNKSFIYIIYGQMTDLSPKRVVNSVH